MKEMLKSKSIILFVIIMLGVIMLGTPITKLETEMVEDTYLSYNFD